MKAAPRTALARWYAWFFRWHNKARRTWENVMNNKNGSSIASEILVVDDEIDIRELMAGILSDEGYETRGASDSDGALAAIYCRTLLPKPWQRCAFWWGFSSSAGFRPGIRIKLAFWLSRPVLGRTDLPDRAGG